MTAYLGRRGLNITMVSSVVEVDRLVSDCILIGKILPLCKEEVKELAYAASVTRRDAKKAGAGGDEPQAGDAGCAVSDRRGLLQLHIFLSVN